ncbi:MAG: hypothetical protein ACRD0N_14680 [Acidimicrobiales bacterium]
MIGRSPAAVDQARRVADTVLYEGYVLYPYRASARKNQLRWQFGVLAPRPFSEAGGSEPFSSQTECILASSADAELDVTVRFLLVQARTVEQAAGGGTFQPVPSLDVGGRFLAAWDEAVEEEVTLTHLQVADLVAASRELVIHRPGSAETETVTGPAGNTAGRIVRRRWPVTGRLRVRADQAGDGLVRVHARVENLTAWGEPGASRDDVVRHSMASVHLILVARGGGFVSMVDPPDGARAAVAACRNEGTWPVLIGDVDRHDTVLSSPITLYDFPEVAPESEGDFCDSTEIDEMLALRVMTLTEEEKRQARGTDARSAEIVDRCDSMPAEILERLHGAVRSLRAATSTVEPPLATGDPA